MEKHGLLTALLNLHLHGRDLNEVSHLAGGWRPQDWSWVSEGDAHLVESR